MSTSKFQARFEQQLRLPHVDSRTFLPGERSESPDEMQLFAALHASGWGVGAGWRAANDNAIGLPNRVSYAHEDHPAFLMYAQVEIKEVVPSRHLPHHRADFYFRSVFYGIPDLIVSVETAGTHGKNPAVYSSDRVLDTVLSLHCKGVLEILRIDSRTFDLSRGGVSRGLQKAVDTIHHKLHQLSA